MIRFLFLNYHFSATSYSVQCLYKKKAPVRFFQLHFILKHYLAHVATLRLHYRQQINYRGDLVFLIKRFGATHKLTGYLMRKGFLRL